MPPCRFAVPLFVCVFSRRWKCMSVTYLKTFTSAVGASWLGARYQSMQAKMSTYDCVRHQMFVMHMFIMHMFIMHMSTFCIYIIVMDILVYAESFHELSNKIKKKKKNKTEEVHETSDAPEVNLLMIAWLLQANYICAVLA